MDSEESRDSSDLENEEDSSDVENEEDQEESGSGGSDVDTDENKTRLYEALQQLKTGAGDFACGGEAPDIPLPGLYIDGVGIVSLPLLEDQARKIIAVAKKAPYGLGEKTLVDESVRKCWQLEPTQINIKNNKFIEAVNSLVKNVKKTLGCDQKAVKSILYKILLYETGGHFKPHRDTEKENGMFATLIVQLPSVFEGGKLIVKHAGRVKEISLDGEENAFGCRYAAHYADCEHEITTIRNGYRLALVYSLCWKAMGEAPSALGCQSVSQNLSRILTDFSEGRHEEKFAWFLSHKYSKAALQQGGIKSLKGHDAAVASAFVAANALRSEDEQFEFHLAQVTRQLDQFGDYDWYGFSACGDEEETIEVESEWYKFDGAVQAMENHELNMNSEVLNYVCPAGKTKDDYKTEFWGEADEEENSGPSGNEGATQTYWYRSYSIIAWPKRNSLKVMCSAGLNPAIDWVGNELKLVKNQDKRNPQYQKAVANVRQILDFVTTGKVEKSSLTERVLCSLTMILMQIADVQLIRTFMTGVLGREFTSSTWRSNEKTVFGLQEDYLIPKMVQLITAVGWKSVSSDVRALFDKCLLSQIKRWVTLIDQLLETFQTEKKELIKFGSKAMDRLYRNLDTEIWQAFGQDEQIQVIGNLIHIQFKHSEFRDLLEKFIEHKVVKNDMRLLSDVITHLRNHFDDKLQAHECFKTLVGYVVEETEESARAGKLSSTVAIQSVIKTAQLLFLIENSTLLQRFVNAVLLASSGDLLKALLGNLKSVAQKGNAHWLMLVDARIQQLEVIEKRGSPSFSWQQECAHIDGHPQVQAFLRGPTETFTYRAFTGIGHARSWASKHFGGGWRDTRTHSATVQTGGTGKNAHAVIQKTRTAHDKKVAIYQTQMKELAALRRSSKRKAKSLDDVEPPAKKQAMNNGGKDAVVDLT